MIFEKGHKVWCQGLKGKDKVLNKVEMFIKSISFKK